jgi:DNA-binding transcriptional regulator YdaS (Cro superfamily)
MKLLDFLRTKTLEERTEFAQKCGTTAAYLDQVARGYRRAGESICINIDKETDGAVRCEDVRPDVDWAYLRGDQAA